MHQTMSRTTNVATPAAMPALPMSPASTSSLSCSGVLSASFLTSAIVCPHSDLGPTAVTRKKPEPSVTYRGDRAEGGERGEAE